jgi:hypothetical protein
VRSARSASVSSAGSGRSRRLRRDFGAPSTVSPPTAVFYAVDAPDENLEELASRFRALELVDYAYVEPPVDLPLVRPEAARNAISPPSITPDFCRGRGIWTRHPEGLMRGLHGPCPAGPALE